MRHIPLCIISMLLLMLSIGLSGCSSISEEDALKGAITNAEDIFENKESVDTNAEADDFEFYLPQELTVKEESENNIILSDGDNRYIVFYNNLENPHSELNYESAKDGKALVYESFKDEDKFGYLQILPSEENDYQIQAGVGGVKITTYTTKKELEKKAEQLMNIARSIIDE